MKSSRDLHQDKARKPIIGKGTPHSREGVEGDLSIRSLKDGIFLFVKYGSLWYKVSKLEVHNPSHSNQTVLNAMSGNNQGSSSNANIPHGGSGNTGIGSGAKFYLDKIKTRLGITGKNYIQSGTTTTTLDRGPVGSDTAFMNIAVGDSKIFTLTPDTASFESSVASNPVVTIKNTTNDTNGSFLKFVKDKGANGANGDDIGTIQFFSDDDGQNQTLFASIICEVDDASNGDTSGKLSLYASCDGGQMRQGLIITGEHDTQEVDVNIAYGSASTTAVAGNITVVGTVDGVDIATRDAILTITRTTADAALPKAGGTMTGDITMTANEKVIYGDAAEYIVGDGSKLILSSTNLIDFDNSRLGGANRITFDAGGTISNFLNEDDMASDSSNSAASQQSIKAYVDANAGGSTKHFFDWHYYGANLASQNYFYANSPVDDYGVNSSINTDLSSSGYSTTTLNNAWRMIRYARRVPYGGELTAFNVMLEATGAAADSDVEVALWWADALTDGTSYGSTQNLTCDHLCTLTFDFSSTSQFMTQNTTSFNEATIAAGDWLFVTLRKTTSGDGSSFNSIINTLWDGA